MTMHESVNSLQSLKSLEFHRAPFLRIDHAVINAHYALDRLAKSVENLGFALTGKSVHSLGSENRLAVFGHSYLELIGLPRDAAKIREEILRSPVGLDGLVFGCGGIGEGEGENEAENASKMKDVIDLKDVKEVKEVKDVKEVKESWEAAGFLTTPVQEFSRDVVVEDENLGGGKEEGEGEGEGGTAEITRRTTKKASFATVRLLPGQISAGRIYACEQRTPELVYQKAWQTHPNTAEEISGLTIVSDDPERLRAQFERLARHALEFNLEILSHEEWKTRFGELSGYGPERPEFFGCLRIDVRSLEIAETFILRSGAPIRKNQDARSIIAALPDFHCLIEFSQTNRFL